MRKKGRNSPLDFLPDYDPAVEWVLSVFDFLSPLRQKQVGVGGVVKGLIPLSEIVAYSQSCDMLLPLSELVQLIRKLDYMYLEQQNIASKKDAGSKKS